LEGKRVREFEILVANNRDETYPFNVPLSQEAIHMMPQEGAE
jgi:hypothetical protein